MKKFVIERIIPGACNFTKEELRHIARSFCEAADKAEKGYSWVQSFITDDKIYCIHVAESEEAIREHSKIARFPINTINEVRTTIDPTTSDASA
jgi:hypothetical protein